MDTNKNILHAVLALQSVAENIRRVEAEAREALFSKDEPDAHREKLQEKTMLLMELFEVVEPFLGGMPEGVRSEIEGGVNDFVRRATQAWELSSVFYMSALLYPEDYLEGEKNDLEKFIDRLRRRHLSSRG